MTTPDHEIPRSDPANDQDLASAPGRRAIWRAATLRMVLPAILTVALFAATVFVVALPAFEHHLRSTRRETARNVVQSAVSLLASYERQVARGDLTLEQAQRRARERLRQIRYGAEGKQYYWITDLQPVVVMHPYLTEIEGTDILDMPDAQGRPLIYSFLDVVDNPRQGGYVAYRWQRHDEAGPREDKISYVQLYEPWGWIVGSGVYVDDVEARIADMSDTLTVISLTILVVILGLTGFMVVSAARQETRRLDAERSRRARERDIATILDALQDAVVAVDATGTIVRLNPVAERLLDAREPGTTGRHLDTAFALTELDGRPITDLFARLFGTENAEAPLQAQLVAEPGSPRTLQISASRIDGAPGGGVIVMHDRTDEVTLRNQLFQAQKLEAVGQLAGGVAHDFNNLLTSILGNAELLADRLADDEEARSSAEEIMVASGRAADLTGQLLAFSRKGKFQVAAVDLNALAEEVARLLSRSIDKRIELQTVLSADGAVVEGDPSQLHHALLNLGLNARDAMPDGGTLTISTRNVHLDDQDRRLRGTGRPAGPYVELAVADTGWGMTEEVRSRIFEPFFTTKGPGEGTGLGLASVYGCVINHGGILDVATVAGDGSTFTILLPRTARALDQRDRPAQPAVSGEGRIMIVDDEEVVRALAERALARYGYEVISCEDGIEAIERLRKEREEIDLVILDLVMPRLSGEQTFDELRRLDPGVPILIASGFTQDAAVQGLIHRGAAGFLAKPFQLAHLARTVDQTIRQHARPEA
ncbi:response regulator [bacterium]|nr:response regulator [bacterium]